MMTSKSMHDSIFRELLKALKETEVVKVTGSFAVGKQNEESDIDFYVEEDEPELEFGVDQRNIDKVKEVLDAFGIHWSSTMVGYIHTQNCGNNIPRQLEFSDLFLPRKNGMNEVEVHGVIFETY